MAGQTRRPLRLASLRARGLAGVQEGHNRLGLGRVDVVDGHAHVPAEISEQAGRAAVEVVSCDDLDAGLEEASDHIERGHAAGDGERMLRGRDLGNMVLCKSNVRNRAATLRTAGVGAPALK